MKATGLPREILAPRRTWIGVVAFLLLLIGGAAVYVWFYFAEGYVWDRDMNNQEIIANAYADYYLAAERFPESLEELVKAGYLPRKASFYAEPPVSGNDPVDVELSCYVVQPPPRGSIEEPRMIGRRSLEDGKVLVEFNPVANAIIRDTIIERQVPRNTEAYSNYIAPLLLNRPNLN